MRRVVRPAASLAALLMLAAVLAGCASSDSTSRPNGTWVPQPSFAGDGGGHADPPVGGGSGSGQAPPAGSGGPGQGGASGTPKPVSPVVASKLNSPTGIAVLPDNTALVGERATGRILRVQPAPGQPVQTVRTITGLSTAGGGGLLDLALSPNFGQDGLIFAYLTTPQDNRVVSFTLNGPLTPVLTGIPRGASDNTGRIAFGPDQELYVATGDAGHPQWATDPHSLAGKVLRITDVGQPAPGNPVPGSPVFASGEQSATGLCATGSALLAVAPTTTGQSAIRAVTAGASLGWPVASAATAPPLGTLAATDTGLGGCAVLNASLFVATLSGQGLLGGQVTNSGRATQVGAFTASLRKQYGRLLTVTAAQDGALWLSTSNRDGHGKPIPADERVLRIVPNAASGGTPPV